MRAAAGVERRAARGAAVGTIQIGGDRKLRTARTAENGVLLQFLAGPRLERVIGKRSMAVLARKIRGAALHLNGDDIEGRIVVGAARLRIKFDAAHFW